MKKSICKVLSVVLAVAMLATVCVSSVSAYTCSGATYSNTNAQYENGVVWSYDYIAGDWSMISGYNNMADAKLTGSHWTTAMNDLISTGVSEYSVADDVASFSAYTNLGILAGGYKCGVFAYNNQYDLNYGRMGLYSANWQALGQAQNGSKKPLLIEGNTQYTISVEFIPLASYDYNYISQIAIGYMGVDGTSAVKVLGNNATFYSNQRVMDSKKPIKPADLRTGGSLLESVSATDKIQTISYTLTAAEAATIAGKQFCLVFGTQRASANVDQVAHGTASTWRLSQFLIRKVTIHALDMSGNPQTVAYENSPAGAAPAGASVDGNIVLPSATDKEVFWLASNGAATLQGKEVALTADATTFKAIDSVGDRAASISANVPKYGTAALRLRGTLSASVVDAADEIGYVIIPKQLVTSDTWFDMTGATVVGDQTYGSLSSRAQWASIKDFDTTGYYAKSESSYQYQVALSLPTAAHKAADFSAVMYIKTGDTYSYVYVNDLSYNTVEAALAAQN